MLKKLKNKLGISKKKAKKKPSKKKKQPVIEESEEEEDLDDYKIRFRAVVEILGAPKEHVESTLKLYLQKVKQTKNLQVVDEFISDVEEKGSMWAVFAEVEMLVKRPQQITDFCFDYMPSSIEVFEPEQVVFTPREISEVFNDLQAKLHKMDMILKQKIQENSLLTRNAHLILRNNILIILKHEDMSLKELAKATGIPEEKTKTFVEALVEKGMLEKKGTKYSLKKEG